MELKEADVVGLQVTAPRETSRSVTSMSTDEMRERGALSISDAVAKLPGVSQLTTGVGISKPVIRGLAGNRVQVNMLGQRFDNQRRVRKVGSFKGGLIVLIVGHVATPGFNRLKAKPSIHAIGHRIRPGA